MFLARRLDRPAPRGQTLVEFALILPILALLTVMALDFGRVFFGWVALQNAARIAADSGAMTADEWADPSNTVVRTQYERTVTNDLQAINCEYASIPDPEFTDVDGDGDVYGHGDRVSVALDCQFAVLTPLAADIVGGSVPLSADAHFRVHKTIYNNLPEAPDLPPPCPAGEAKVPDMVGDTMQDAQDLWVFAGFAKSKFSPNVTGTNKSAIVLTQPTTPASAPDDCIVDSATVEVTHS